MRKTYLPTYLPIQAAPRKTYLPTYLPAKLTVTGKLGKVGRTLFDERSRALFSFAPPPGGAFPLAGEAHFLSRGRRRPWVPLVLEGPATLVLKVAALACAGLGLSDRHM